MSDEKKSTNEMFSSIRVTISIKTDVPDTLSLIDLLNVTRFKVLPRRSSRVRILASACL